MSARPRIAGAVEKFPPGEEFIEGLQRPVTARLQLTHEESMLQTLSNRDFILLTIVFFILAGPETYPNNLPPVAYLPTSAPYLSGKALAAGSMSRSTNTRG
jgi:hypothetical protein